MGLLMTQQSVGGVALTDAELYFAATGMIDPTQQAAVTNIIADMKTAGIWATDIKAAYLYVGGSAAFHKWNLRNPVDSDAAFRGVFNGTVTHNANGITGDGTTGWMDTKLNGFTESLNDNDHLSVYVRSVASTGAMDIGSYNGGIRMYGIKSYNSATNVFFCSYRFDTDGFLNVVHNGNQGFWTLTRRAAADGEAYKNGVSVGTMGDSTQDIPSQNIGVLARSAPSTDQFSANNISFASIGKGLTAAKQLALYVAVRRFQEALGRGLGSAFSDNFDDNSLDTSKWTAIGATDISTSETSQELRMTADSSYSGSLSLGGVVSARGMNFVGRYAEITLPSPSSNLGANGALASGGTQFRIDDVANANNSARIILDQNQNTYGRYNNGVASSSVSATGYNTNTKWRITHNASSNTYTFATMVAGLWVDRFTSAAADWSPTNVTISIVGYIYGTNQQNVTTRIDDVISDALYI